MIASKDRQKLVNSELLFYGKMSAIVLVVGVCLVAIIYGIGWIQSATQYCTDLFKANTVATDSTTAGTKGSEPVAANKFAMTSSGNAESQAQVSSGIVIDGKNSGAATSTRTGEVSPADPALVGLQQQNAQLKDQIKTLKQNNVKNQRGTENLKQQLDEAKEIVGERNADIDRLRNNVRIADESIRSKDVAISELTTALGRLKNPPSTEVHVFSTTPFAASEDTFESADERWPNVQDFQPVSYKQDVVRRLSKIAAERRLSKQQHTKTDVVIHFTIERDGQPNNIQLLTPIQDEETMKDCIAYIEAAGLSDRCYREI